MALKPCINCNSNISEVAKICPKCKYDSPFISKLKKCPECLNVINSFNSDSSCFNCGFPFSEEKTNIEKPLRSNEIKCIYCQNIFYKNELIEDLSPFFEGILGNIISPIFFILAFIFFPILWGIYNIILAGGFGENLIKNLSNFKILIGFVLTIITYGIFINFVIPKIAELLSPIITVKKCPYCKKIQRGVSNL